MNAPQMPGLAGLFQQPGKGFYKPPAAAAPPTLRGWGDHGGNAFLGGAGRSTGGRGLGVGQVLGELATKAPYMPSWVFDLGNKPVSINATRPSRGASMFEKPSVSPTPAPPAATRPASPGASKSLFGFSTRGAKF